MSTQSKGKASQEALPSSQTGFKLAACGGEEGTDRKKLRKGACCKDGPAGACCCSCTEDGCCSAACHRSGYTHSHTHTRTQCSLALSTSGFKGGKGLCNLGLGKPVLKGGDSGLRLS